MRLIDVFPDTDTFCGFGLPAVACGGILQFDAKRRGSHRHVRPYPPLGIVGNLLKRRQIVGQMRSGPWSSAFRPCNSGRFRE